MKLLRSSSVASLGYRGEGGDRSDGELPAARGVRTRDMAYGGDSTVGYLSSVPASHTVVAKSHFIRRRTGTAR